MNLLRPLRILTYLLLLIWCSYGSLSFGVDPDLWGHVQYGQDDFKYGLQQQTTYAYGVDRDYPWINHENLSEVVFAFTRTSFGIVGIQAIRILVILFFLTLLIVRGHQSSASWISICAVILLSSVNVMFNWMARPQLLSYLSCVALIATLTWCFKGWEGRICVLGRSPELEQKPRRKRASKFHFFSRDYLAAESLQPRLEWLWLIVPILIFWTNSHGGFVAGVCIVVAYLGLRAVELQLVAGKAAKRSIAFITLVGTVAIAATLLNPYGWGLHLWLAESLGIPRPEIVEWRGIDWARPKAWNYALLIGSTIGAVLGSKRRVDLTHSVILILVAWQSIVHHRHIPFFVILFGFFILPHVDGFLSSSLKSIERIGHNQAWRTWVVTIASVTMILGTLWFGVGLYRRMQTISVLREQYPVDALQFMKDHDLHKEGKIVVMYGWAQYVLGAFGARTPEDEGLLLACDGRFRTCYPQELLDMLLDFELGDWTERSRSPDSPPIDGGRILEFRTPDMVLVNNLQSHAMITMFEHEDTWSVLYQDRVATLWGRKTVYDDETSPKHFPQSSRVITSFVPAGAVPWPAYPE